jgi:single-stranded-DNA-specific exonuclease
MINNIRTELLTTDLFTSNEPFSFKNYLNHYNIMDNEINDFLKPNEKIFFREKPYLYNNMKEAVDLFKWHYFAGEDIYILSDSGDVDGLTSTVILYQYIQTMTSIMQNELPNMPSKVKIFIHEHKERGLQDDIIYNKLKKIKHALLIIPDSGTNDQERMLLLRRHNDIDTIVLDHHDFNAPFIASDGGLVVNNQPFNNNHAKDANNHLIPSPYGSGCLVTHKFLQALDNEFNFHISNGYIDMVALSLISDIMNMSDMQNRAYYYYGLETIDRICNPFLYRLIETLTNPKYPYTQHDITFKIVPKLNSVLRSTDQKLKGILYKAFMINATNDQYDKVIALISKAHTKQTELVQQISDELLPTIDYNNNLIVVSSNNIPTSYNGLIASRLSNNHPIIVGRITNNILSGSYRSPIDIKIGQDATKDLVLNKQGHTNASGISVSIDNIPKLIEYYNTQELPLPKAFALYTYQHKDIANNDYHLFKSLCVQYDESFNKYPNIYGKGLDEPNICIKDVPITNIEVLKNNHTVKATIAPNITLMWLWLTNDKVKELKEKSDQDTLLQDTLLDILGIPNINIFNRKKTYQFIVKDYVIKPSTPFD